jgi:glutaredoxin
MIITIYSLPNCIYCQKAKALAKANMFETVERKPRDLTKQEWVQKTGKIPKTVPQIFIGNKYIGGYTDLQKFFARRM